MARSRMNTRIERIVSGGQTGADRAALDWAIFRDVPHGGWCPKGRKAEDGTIPASYEPARVLLDFINSNEIAVLNVAGSRGSKEPEVSAFVKRVLEEALFSAPASMIGGPGEG